MSFFGKNNEPKRTLTISGDEDYLDGIEAVLRYLEHLGNVGSTRTVNIWFDGDGAASIRVIEPKTNKRVEKILNRLIELDDHSRPIRIDFD